MATVGHCEQCDTTEYDSLTEVAYRWTDQVAGENPRRIQHQLVCDTCYYQLERMARDGMARFV